MATQRYSVTPHPIETLLTWVKSGEIAIGDKPPERYFGEFVDQVNGGAKRCGGITDETALRENLTENCVPETVLDGTPLDYDAFLAERRRLMAQKIKRWFEVLS